MIIVIADDFTGAAEIAGIGLRYNLKAELVLGALPGSGSDLLVYCTDSRSLNKVGAETITAEVVNKAASLKPDFIYKKIDSVLRGYVLDELRIQMKNLGLNKALIVPANPSLGRTIKNGEYFIHGKLVSETDFAADPEFAIKDSSVLRMIKARTDEAIVLKHNDELPSEGIVIGEVETAAGMAAWAMKADDSSVLAGAGDFFNVLLERNYKAVTHPAIPLELPYLYVSGTAFGKSRALIKKIKQQMDCVVYIPLSMMQTGNINNEGWFSTIKEMLEQHKKAVIAIDDEEMNSENMSPVLLRTVMAKAVKRVLAEGNVKELFIEGGSTAAAILNECAITRLFPINELQRGVVRMKANDIYITVKPGSYELPAQIQKLYNI